MALPYLIQKHNSSIGEKGLVYVPQATVYGNLRTKDLAQIIERSTSLTKGDVLAAISALTDAIESQLSQGYSITLDDFGTFSLQIKNKRGSAKTDPKDVDLTDTDGVIIRFKSAPQLRKSLGEIKIVKYDPKNLLNNVATD